MENYLHIGSQQNALVWDRIFKVSWAKTLIYFIPGKTFFWPFRAIFMYLYKSGESRSSAAIGWVKFIICLIMIVEMYLLPLDTNVHNSSCLQSIWPVFPTGKLWKPLSRFPYLINYFLSILNRKVKASKICAPHLTINFK